MTMADPSALPEDRSVQWLSDEEQRLWRAYLAVTKHLWEQLDDDLSSACDITLNEYEILVRVSEAESGAVRMATLAEQVFQSKSGLSHTVQRMERRGLVVRERSMTDGRGRDCRLTPAGREKLAKSAPHHVGSVRARMISRLSDEEQQTFYGLLATLCDGMPACAGDSPDQCL